MRACVCIFVREEATDAHVFFSRGHSQGMLERERIDVGINMSETETIGAGGLINRPSLNKGKEFSARHSGL